MLKRIIINKIALIEHLDISFTDGFNVLTGETGAGKSIIIDAVNLVIGERASRELIKHGAQKASVEAVFSIPKGNAKLLTVLEENGILTEAEEEIVLSREITLSGKSVCRINGVLVNLATQKAVSTQLIDIHGQHEHQSLLSPSTHLATLDAFAGDLTSVQLSEIREIYHKIRKIEAQLNQGFLNETERERRIDILKYQVDEISHANLTIGEEEILEEELNKLANAEKILLALESSFEALNGDSVGALGNIKDASRRIDSISGFSEEYAEVQTRLDDCYYTLEDIAFTLRGLRQSFEYDPSRLEEVEQRLDLINTLKRKYGSGIDEILNFRQACSEELEALLSSAEVREKLLQEKQQLIVQYQSAAAKLTAARKKAADALSLQILEQLKDLGMQKAQFDVQFTVRGDTIHPDGAEDAEFMLSANAGEPLKPLSRVASGGEMSRIMLALKAIIAKIDQIDTLIFDEVDTGVSGYIASVVGKKMRGIAETAQVICITHLPQVAAMADSHYLVKKEMTDNSTTTNLVKLSLEERYGEIARIMGAGEDSRYALEHAKELVDLARS